MGIIKDLFKAKKEAEFWKDQSEKWRLEYKREMLRNEAWRNTILEITLSGHIDHKTQRLFYDVMEDKEKSIYKLLSNTKGET